MNIKRESLLITLLAILLIYAALYKLLGFLDFDYYQFMFQQFSPRWILVRYFLSVSTRLIIILAALGIFFRNNHCRRLVLLLTIVSVLTIYWKHPFFVFKNISILTEYEAGFNQLPVGTITQGLPFPQFPKDLRSYHLKYPMFPWFSMAFYDTIDLIFSFFLIYFLTRPLVKEQFKDE